MQLNLTWKVYIYTNLFSANFTDIRIMLVVIVYFTLKSWLNSFTFTMSLLKPYRQERDTLNYFLAGTCMYSLPFSLYDSFYHLLFASHTSR